MLVTDEEAAIQSISAIANPSQDQKDAKDNIETILKIDDPFIDIHELFGLYSILYFRSLLVPCVEVSWSARLTLCAGICELVRDPNNGNKHTKIRLKLSEPLLKFRPRSDVINTLLHECIHAYFFITTSWRHSRGDDGSGHGAGFLLLADAINNHGGYHISIYHTFHDEVDSYRTHIWECDGLCRQEPPFFGLVKRSMNRPPGKYDSWWQKHEWECGGKFAKIAEPDLTKDQVEKLSGLKRAGLQKNKLDAWVISSKKTKDAGDPSTDGGTTDANRSANYGANAKDLADFGVYTSKRSKQLVTTPHFARTPSALAHIADVYFTWEGDRMEPSVSKRNITFLDLAPELRLAIYELILLHEEPLRLSWKGDPCNVRIPDLLATNRQIREEASKIFYGRNRFEARVFTNAERFLRHLQPNSIACLKSLNVYSSAFGGFSGVTEHGRLYLSEIFRTTVNYQIADYSKKGLKAGAVMVSVPAGEHGDGVYHIRNLKLTEIEDFAVEVDDWNCWTLAKK